MLVCVFVVVVFGGGTGVLGQCKWKFLPISVPHCWVGFSSMESGAAPHQDRLPRAPTTIKEGIGRDLEIMESNPVLEQFPTADCTGGCPERSRISPQ